MLSSGPGCAPRWSAFFHPNQALTRASLSGAAAHPPMRLTQIKLSGFKSFAEPTTFQLPGQLVGVVGPNGCG